MPTNFRGFDSGVSRKVTLAVGILLFLIGMPFLALGAIGLAKLVWEGTDQSIVVIILLAALVGAFCCWTGVKMVFGIRRKDGGLLSPAVLRSGGALFLIMPVILILTEDRFTLRSIWTLLELGFYVAVATACFALANRRQIRTLSQETARNDT